MKVMDLGKQELGSAGAWHTICDRKPGKTVGDPFGIGVGAVNTEGTMVRQSGAKVVAEDTMGCPRGPDVGSFVDKDFNAWWGKRVAVKIVGATMHAVIRRYCTVWTKRS